MLDLTHVLPSFRPRIFAAWDLVSVTVLTPPFRYWYNSPRGRLAVLKSFAAAKGTASLETVPLALLKCVHFVLQVNWQKNSRPPTQCATAVCGWRAILYLLPHSHVLSDIIRDGLISHVNTVLGDWIYFLVIVRSMMLSSMSFQHIPLSLLTSYHSALSCVSIDISISKGIRPAAAYRHARDCPSLGMILAMIRISLQNIHPRHWAIWNCSSGAYQRDMSLDSFISTSKALFWSAQCSYRLRYLHNSHKRQYDPHHHQ